MSVCKPTYESYTMYECGCYSSYRNEFSASAPAQTPCGKYEGRFELWRRVLHENGITFMPSNTLVIYWNLYMWYSLWLTRTSVGRPSYIKPLSDVFVDVGFSKENREKQMSGEHEHARPHFVAIIPVLLKLRIFKAMTVFCLMFITFK